MNEPRRAPPYPSFALAIDEHRKAYAWLLDALERECDEVRTELGDYGWRFEVMVRWGEGDARVRTGIAPEQEVGVEETGYSYYSLNWYIEQGSVTREQVIRSFLKKRPAGWKPTPTPASSTPPSPPTG